MGLGILRPRSRAADTARIQLGDLSDSVEMKLDGQLQFYSLQFCSFTVWHASEATALLKSCV